MNATSMINFPATLWPHFTMKQTILAKTPCKNVTKHVEKVSSTLNNNKHLPKINCQKTFLV